MPLANINSINAASSAIIRFPKMTALALPKVVTGLRQKDEKSKSTIESHQRKVWQRSEAVSRAVDDLDGNKSKVLEANFLTCW